MRIRLPPHAPTKERGRAGYRQRRIWLVVSAKLRNMVVARLKSVGVRRCCSFYLFSLAKVRPSLRGCQGTSGMHPRPS